MLEIQQKLDESNANIKSLSAQLENYKNHVAQVEKVLKETQIKSNILRHIVNSLTDDNIALNVSYSLLSEEKDSLKAQMDRMTAEHNQFKQSLNNKVESNEEDNVVKIKRTRAKRVQA